MDLVLMIVGAAALFVGLRMRAPDRERGGFATVLVIGGGAVLVIGLIIFGIAFAAGLGEGFQRGMNR